MNSSSFISPEEVKKIAQLANLTLKPGEIKKFQVQLSEALRYVAILNRLKTQKLTATAWVTQKNNVTREDKIKPSLAQAKVLEPAKATYQGYFKIKSILEKP